LIVRLFHVSEKKYVDIQIAKKAQRYIIVVTLATLLPSSYLAYKLVQEEVFRAKAKTFINSNFNFENTNVAQIKIDPKTREIKAFLIGQHIPQKELDSVSKQMSRDGLENARLKIYQNGEKDSVDILTLKSDIVRELYKNSQTALDEKTKEIEVLKERVKMFTDGQEYLGQLPQELSIVFPKLRNIVISQTILPQEDDKNSSKSYLIINTDTKRKIGKKEFKQIEAWLKVRTKSENIKIYINKI
jgi:hypothetical protein